VLAACGGGGSSRNSPTTAGNDASNSSSGGGAGSSSSLSGGSSPRAGPVETRAIGYGSETTGAGSSPATKVAVSNLADAQAAIDAYTGTAGLEITYNGTVDFSAYYNTAANTGTPVLDQNGVALNQGDILTCTLNGQPAQILEIKGSSSKPKSNITIIGADGSSAQFGIHITSTSNNIIIRNMTIGLTPGGGNADIISLEGNASSGVPYNIWIDHNNLFTKNILCPGAGDSSFDGMIDVKKGVDKVTISYNWLHDHEKTSLNGFSDSDTVTRHITFAHNIFENLTSRTPLQRFGYSHMLNNYFSNIGTSGINVRMGGYSLIEGNYFENVQNPVTSRDSSAIGYWELRNNNITGPADFTTYGIKWVASGSTPTKDATDWATTAVFPAAELTYIYTVDSPSCLKEGLRDVVGAGKGLATLKCN
jgi:pectate lyase